MTTSVVVGLAIVALLTLLAARVPVAFALIVAGGLGLTLLEGWDFAFAVLGRDPFSAVARFSLVIIPLFVLMGAFAKNAGLGADIFRILARWLRHVPGGLPLATIIACAGFGAVSGSSVAAVATLGPISIAEMRKYGYSDRVSTGVVAAAGTLGILIPPSIVLVLYGVLSGLSIERLLLAGIIPGVISAVIYAGISAFVARRDLRRTAESGTGSTPIGMPTDRDAPTGDISARAPEADFHAAPVADTASSTLPWRPWIELGVLFGVVVGGIYLGWLTATEAAAAGAIAAFLIFALRLGARGHLVLQGFRDSLRETVSVSGMIFALLVGAAIFTSFLVIAGVPRQFGEFAAGLDVPPLLLVVLVLLVLIPLGMFLDGLSILLIMVPLLHPLIVTDLGFDGLWFAVLVVKIIELGLITPPVGINAYVVAGTMPGLRADVVFRGVLPYYLGDVLAAAALFAMPSLVTWLPSVLD